MPLPLYYPDVDPEREKCSEADTLDTASGDGFDPWLALQTVTDETRANLVADIVGHPKELPSVEELAYTNPPIGERAVRRHLETLVDVGVVRERSFETDERVSGFPSKFYELTDRARELFDRNGLFPVEPWRREYNSIEKTPRIRELESLPRPERDE